MCGCFRSRSGCACSSKSRGLSRPSRPRTSWAGLPLGALNPPGHTFPTDHQDIYLTTFSSGATPVPLYAPGTITVTQARLVHYLPSSGPNPPDDCALDFMSRREASVDFGHVRTLSPSLLAALGPFDQQCSTYCRIRDSSSPTATRSGRHHGDCRRRDRNVGGARSLALRYPRDAARLRERVALDLERERVRSFPRRGLQRLLRRASAVGRARHARVV